MLFFGHIGITVGTVVALDRVLSRRRDKTPDSSRTSKLSSVIASVDYRLLLIGSMLPDIIDKPIGIYLFPDTFGSGRIFGHSLLFLLVLLSIGIYRYRRYAKIGVLVLTFGSFMHLLCDGLWSIPETLLWPAYGFDFPQYEHSHYLREMLERLIHKPSAYVPEIIGLTVSALVGARLLMNGRLVRFLKYGTLK